MTQLVESIEGVLCQTDDILVFGRTEAEHDERLHVVLTRLHEANLTINPSKTEFRKASIKYVGHIIGPSGISADPERVQGIKNLEAPTDIHGVRRLLHYRPFICPCRIRVENALKTHVKRISFPTRISKIQSKPTIDTR